jgi:glyoxylase-like metal-dependent hydrolase (beta-lactamase superfamily II)
VGGGGVSALTVEQIRPHLWHWTAPHPDWKPEYAQNGGWGRDVSSYALTRDELVLIDPQLPPLGDDRDRFWRALDRDVEEHGEPQIVLTCYWHARSSSEILDRLGGRVLVDERTAEKAREHAPVTDTFAVGEPLPGGIEAVDLGKEDEAALWLPDDRALAFGDALLDGPRVCPDTWLASDDGPQRLRAALAKLLDRPLELILLTHGGPVLDNAHERLRAALEA